MSDRFFTAQPLVAGEFVLDGPEAHHLASVRRLRAGETVTLFNGDGAEYPAEVIAADRKRVTLNVRPGVAVDRELGFSLIIASAVPKGDRADFLIEKLTELGVTRFVPLLTARSVVTPRETKVEKFERIVIEASKQCGRNRLLAIDPPTAFDTWIARPDIPATKCILHPSVHTHESPRSASGIAFTIGPEGGFTDDEIASAAMHGWRPVSFGASILRIETAALAAACSAR